MPSVLTVVEKCERDASASVRGGRDSAAYHRTLELRLTNGGVYIGDGAAEHDNKFSDVRS